MNRIEAFSDGVIAIIITIMVLELKTPEDHNLESLLKLMPIFLSYALSFLVTAIFWVNHHQLLRMTKKADGRLVWANIFWLFWLSLIPFVTAYMGNNHREPLAVALYAVVLTLASTAFTILRYIVSREHLDNFELTEHHNKIHLKGLLSIFLYASSALLAFVSPYLSFAVFILIPLSYFLPDRKLEKLSTKVTNE